MKDSVKEILLKVQNGELSADDALLALKKQPFEDLGYAHVDYHRKVRQGTDEVVYGSGKTAEQIEGIVGNMLSNGLNNVLVTRLSEEKAAALGEKFPLEYHREARIAVVSPVPTENPRGNIVVVSAGTSDIPVCEEAAVTAETLGSRVTRIYDVGVSGLHRLLSHLDEITQARVIVAVAGMEGALASVVAGLVDCPVVAVPTSVGYGANFGGLAALLAMLNSCASGVSVVNIDNGFGAGYLAHIINNTGEKR
ncbi:MAG: nickel pincer cofactor biosynthesis protein LarB [Christensenellales bacterium]|nr:nickel pincer cofactor biosynthesis protein LarB [Christensenellales bacterium]